MAMRIFNDPAGDPMLLDSAQGLAALYEELTQFLRSGVEAASFSARTDGSPEPYAEFLGGLRIRRNPTSSQLCISGDRWLDLSATEVELGKFAQLFLGLGDNAHHHWYSSPVSLIIERDDWRAGHDS